MVENDDKTVSFRTASGHSLSAAFDGREVSARPRRVGKYEKFVLKPDAATKTVAVRCPNGEYRPAVSGRAAGRTRNPVSALPVEVRRLTYQAVAHGRAVGSVVGRPAPRIGRTGRRS